MNLFLIYITVGYFVSLFVYNKLEEENITGDQILSQANYNVRFWFEEHQNCYKVTIAAALLLIIIIWPYILYKMINNNNNDNHGYSV